ncbi:hypothetical protein, partial [Enterobacter asburiae]|uniref:hypothetical protein n=1 Tax=Enterobacter asburiae TaxID=61645 RepID=UPI002FFAC891
MINAKQQSLNNFKPKIKAINIVILGALYSWGSCASAQTISADTDVTGQNVTDGVLIDTAGVTANINGGSKISNTPDKNSVTINPTDATKGATLNVSGAGTTISGGKIGIDVAKEGANKQVISSQADSLIKISRIWA